METVDDVGQEDCDAVQVVEEAVDTEWGVVGGSTALADVVLELAHVLARREPVEKLGQV